MSFTGNFGTCINKVYVRSRLRGFACACRIYVYVIIIVFFENMAIDAFLECLLICLLFNIFVYGSCICICRVMQFTEPDRIWPYSTGSDALNLSPKTVMFCVLCVLRPQRRKTHKTGLIPRKRWNTHAVHGYSTGSDPLNLSPKQSNQK